MSENFTVKLNKRILEDGWLKSYLKLTSAQESPEMFHLWVGLVVMSVALRRRVYLDRGFYRLFPNLYVVLVAKSAACKKTTAADIGYDFIKRLDSFQDLRGKLHTIKQKATPEGLIMSMQHMAWEESEQRMTPDGALFIYAPELKVFLTEAYAKDLIPILTDLYTCPDDWDYTTRSRETEVINNAYPVFIGCSNPRWYAQCITEDAQAGGFTGRIVHVVEDTSKRIWSPIRDAELDLKLLHDLAVMSSMKGEIKLTKSADAYCDQWYQEYRAPENQDLETFYARYHDHMLKVATLLAVGEFDTMEIDIPIIDAAIHLLERTEKKMGDAFESVGSTREASIGDRIVASLEHAQGWVSRSVLMRRTYKYVKNAEEFQQLITAKLVSGEILPAQRGNSLFYAVPEYKDSVVFVTEHKHKGGA